MEEKNLATTSESLNQDEEKIALSRIISHAIGNAMAEVVPALESVLRLPNLPLNVAAFVSRAQLVARDLTSKTTALAELFGESDSISKPKMASFEIVQFFEAFTKHLNHILAGKIRCKIQFVLAPDSETGVIFDSRRIATILYYLIANALQHGRTANKNVKLLCKAGQDRFELIVRDYGGGVPKEIQPVLFTKFQQEFNIKQQMNDFLPPRIQGLGLPLCRKLAKDMGGELEFRNYRTGAQFTLILPQDFSRMQEPTVYFPDDALLHSCMSSLWLYLDEQKEDEE